jgi:hypothetical protein
MNTDFNIGYDNKVLYSPLGDIIATYRKPGFSEANTRRYIPITIRNANTKDVLDP